MKRTVAKGWHRSELCHPFICFQFLPADPAPRTVAAYRCLPVLLIVYDFLKMIV